MAIYDYGDDKKDPSPLEDKVNEGYDFSLPDGWGYKGYQFEYHTFTKQYEKKVAEMVVIINDKNYFICKSHEYDLPLDQQKMLTAIPKTRSFRNVKKMGDYISNYLEECDLKYDNNR